jgi:hypothetical protein
MKQIQFGDEELNQTPNVEASLTMQEITCSLPQRHQLDQNRPCIRTINIIP